MLKHIVLFSFKEEIDEIEITRVDNLFKELPGKIDDIIDFDSGINISPENLNKGFTHAYCLSFFNETTRDLYLVHEKHQDFSLKIKDLLRDVLVFDYEINKI